MSRHLDLTESDELALRRFLEIDNSETMNPETLIKAAAAMRGQLNAKHVADAADAVTRAEFDIIVQERRDRIASDQQEDP